MLASVWTSDPLHNGLRYSRGIALDRSIFPGYQEDGVWRLLGEQGTSCNVKAVVLKCRQASRRSTVKKSMLALVFGMQTVRVVIRLYNATDCNGVQSANN